MHSELSALAADLSRFIRDSHQDSQGVLEPDNVRFSELALRLFPLQYALNPPYQALCRARGISLQTVSDWKSIPAVSTAAFKDCEFSCLQKTARTRYFESSGTTQDRRSNSFHSAESLGLYETSLIPWFKRHLIPENQATSAHPSHALFFLSLTPPPEQAPNSSLVHMLATIAQQSWFRYSEFVGQLDATGAWELNANRIQTILQNAAEKSVSLLLAGTAFNLVHLLDRLESEDLRVQLPKESRIMETGGYKGRSRAMTRDELHAQLSYGLGIPTRQIVTEYGMTELGSQAYDRVAGESSTARRLHFPPWARASVISSETGQEVADGESGLVRVVDLANTFSVMAVETEDLAIRRGNGLELIGRRVQSEPRGCSLMAV